MTDKATHAMAIDPDRSLFVVEDLRVKNMTKNGTPKRRVRKLRLERGTCQGRSQHGESCRPAGGCFASSSPASSDGKGKLVIKVPPQFSLQECAHCGHIHPDNRPSQAEFVCQRCGHKDNAD